MRTAILLAFGALMLLPARARAQGGLEVSDDTGDDFMSPRWFGIVEDADRPPGRLVAGNEEVHVTTRAAQTFIPKTSAAPDAHLSEAKGDFTVKAHFREKYMALTNQPGPYGPAIAAETTESGATYLYCAAFGNGTFIVGGAGPGMKPFRLRGPEAHPAVNKAGAPGDEVTQEIALSVDHSRVRCAINGALVATFDKATVVSPGRLVATDGVYGFHVGRTMDVWVTGLSLTTP